MDGANLLDTLLVSLAALTVTAALLFYWFAVARRRVFASPMTTFVLYQALFVAGMFVAIDYHQDQALLWVVVGGFAAAIIGARATIELARFRPTREVKQFLKANPSSEMHPKWARMVIVGVLLISITAGIAYAYRVGYNTFALSFSTFLDQGQVDAVAAQTLRTQISVVNYAASGFAMQFTAVLLPLILSVILMRGVSNRNRSAVLLACVLFLFDLYFLTISGARGLMIKALLPALLLFSKYGPLPILSRKTRGIFVGGCLFLLLFYITTTVVTGRSDVRASDASLPELVTGSFVEVYQRVIGWQVEGQVIVMKMLLEREPVMGREWWNSLRTIVPGVSRDDAFAAEVYRMLYRGDTSGSFGLQLWFSLLFNWGTLGVIFGGFLTGALLQGFTILLVRSPKTLLQTSTLFVAGHHLAFVRDPYSIFLEGCVSALLLYVLVVIGQREKVRTASNTAIRYSHDTRVQQMRVSA